MLGIKIYIATAEDRTWKFSDGQYICVCWLYISKCVSMCLFLGKKKLPSPTPPPLVSDAWDGGRSGMPFKQRNLCAQTKSLPPLTYYHLTPLLVWKTMIMYAPSTFDNARVCWRMSDLLVSVGVAWWCSAGVGKPDLFCSGWGNRLWLAFSICQIGTPDPEVMYALNFSNSDSNSCSNNYCHQWWPFNVIGGTLHIFLFPVQYRASPGPPCTVCGVLLLVPFPWSESRISGLPLLCASPGPQLRLSELWQCLHDYFFQLSWHLLHMAQDGT